MDPSIQLNNSARCSVSTPRNPLPQQHVVPSSRPQMLQQHHPHPQAPPTAHQLAHQMSGVQLHNTMNNQVPSSVPNLIGNFTPASGMACQGMTATPGLPRHDPLTLRNEQLGVAPHFTISGQTHGTVSERQPGTPLPHPWQQQLRPRMPGSFPSTSQEQLHPPFSAKQPLYQGSGWIMAPQYLQSPGYPVSVHRSMPQLQLSPAVQSAFSPAGPKQAMHSDVHMAQPVYKGIRQTTGASNYAESGLPQQLVQPKQQPLELDLNDLPCAIKVMEMDKKERSGPFLTDTEGLLPPLVTTSYVTVDRGNASPRFVRSSLYSIPQSADMLRKSGIPFSIVVSPFAWLEEGEFAPPVVDCAIRRPPRCDRCGAYMCSFMKFTEDGRKFTCHICQAITEVPADYFQPLDHAGVRTDKYQKPELHRGSYDYVLPGKFCRMKDPSSVLFVMDVSHCNVKSGLVQLLCRNMKSILASLPREFPGGPRTRVGFITYSNEVDMYRKEPASSKLEMVNFDAIEDKILPIMEGFLMDPEKDADSIDDLMKYIEIKSAANNIKITESVLGTAIKAGLEALEKSNCSGKLLVFNSSVPVKEPPQTDYYDQLGKDCSTAGARVDVFMAHDSIMDMATIGQVVRLTGGQVYKHTPNIPFGAYSDGGVLTEYGDVLVKDLVGNLKRTSAFDVVLRVCTSLGVRPVNFYGNFYKPPPSEVEISGMNADQAVTIELKHNRNLITQKSVYIQVTVLFTTVGGQRRVRVHNLALNVCSNVDELYKYFDPDAAMNLLLKQFVSREGSSTPRAIREEIISRAAQILAYYRKHSREPCGSGQIQLPDRCALLPLLVNSLFSCDAISAGKQLSVKSRMYQMLLTMSMNVEDSQRYLYPSIIPLLDPDRAELVEGDLTRIRCTMDEFWDDVAYIMDNGIALFLWVSKKVDKDWIKCVFGVESYALINIRETRLKNFQNPKSQMVRNVLANVRKRSPRQMGLRIVRLGDSNENYCRKLLVEDDNPFHSQSLSYLSFAEKVFASHLRKKIQVLI